MPVEDVGHLLQRWRDAGNLVSRGRVAADGIRMLRELSPQERRVLARALAEDGAPELASYIESHTGGALDAADLQDVADGLLALDPGQVKHLTATLANPDERRRLAREAFATPSVTPTPTAPPASTPPGPPPSPLMGVAGLHAIARNEVPQDRPDVGDQALGHPGLGEATLTEVTLNEVALTPPEPADRREPPPSDDRPEPPEPGDRPEAAEPGDRPEPPDPGDPHEAAGVALEAAASHAVADDHLDDHAEPWAVPADSTDVTAVVDRLRQAGSAAARFAVLSPATLATVGAAGALRVLEAVPAGWQRRRAVQRLLAAGTLDGVDLGALMALFPGRVDATFVAGGLIEAGIADLHDLGHALPERTRQRLVVRMAR